VQELITIILKANSGVFLNGLTWNKALHDGVVFRSTTGLLVAQLIMLEQLLRYHNQNQHWI
jgi:hypothetical protein